MTVLRIAGKQCDKNRGYNRRISKVHFLRTERVQRIMENWNEIREEYARGGVTHRELAEKFGVPVGSLRRRAAQEGWSAMRSAKAFGGTGNASCISLRLKRQLDLSDRLVDVISKALDDPDELFRHVAFAKSGDGFVCETERALNEERLVRLVKALGELFEIQRVILGVHEYKDELSAAKLEQDERLTISKLEKQSELALRKLEIELLKLEGDCSAPDDDNFFAAFSAGEDE